MLRILAWLKTMVRPISGDACPGCGKPLSSGKHAECLIWWAIK